MKFPTEAYRREPTTQLNIPLTRLWLGNTHTHASATAARQIDLAGVRLHTGGVQANVVVVDSAPRADA